MKTKIIARIKKSFPAESESIYRDITDFVADSLHQLGISKELGARCVLLSEETTIQFLRAAPEGSSLQVPVEAIGLLMGIFTLLGMTQTMCNTTGDVAASLIVARSENLLDDKVYNEL